LDRLSCLRRLYRNRDLNLNANNFNLPNSKSASADGIEAGRIAQAIRTMKTYNCLYEKLASFENLEKAFKNAKRGKSSKPYVIEFELKLKENLSALKTELESSTYFPKPLKKFTVRDPKIRIIHASDFRDRIVHHALCNIIEPIFEKSFIYDSYANRIGKGTLKAMQRFDYFKRKVSINGAKLNEAKYKNMVVGYALKADIKSYFDSISQTILLNIIKRKITDQKVIWLISLILQNYKVGGGAMAQIPRACH
jgi:RNA-directed DNA polymerase